jgi:adenine deaminase
MQPTSFTVSGNIVDIHNQMIFKGEVYVQDGRIASIVPKDVSSENYILPGFIDSHVHIESSMIVPSEFARLAVVHGTVATVSDPHEIANVLGVKGVEFMIDNGKKVPFKFYFGAPSCVPATNFETAGAEINVEDIEYLLSKPEILYLAEMMNWPGVLHKDPLVYQKIAIAQKHTKKVDGHAPGLKGIEAKDYASAGISTDHECFTKEEALDKLAVGMKILIREGSAAKNFDELISLLNEYEDHIMFCSDDKHPDSLVEGHINTLVKRALSLGIDLFKVLRAACVNPVLHYGLSVGLLRKGDVADFIVVNNLTDFDIFQTYVQGVLVAEYGKSTINSVEILVVNNFETNLKKEFDFDFETELRSLPVIHALDGQLITRQLDFDLNSIKGSEYIDLEKDILKIAVVNRYSNKPPAVAFIHGFGLLHGAISSSVAHDSHNIVVVGTNNEDICEAVNLIIKNKGGISIANGKQQSILKLPIAGLMSDLPGEEVAQQYIQMDRVSKELGSKLSAPFMTLSFMALLVIPKIKLSDLGLFDGEKFAWVEV